MAPKRAGVMTNQPAKMTTPAVPANKAVRIQQPNSLKDATLRVGSCIRCDVRKPVEEAILSGAWQQVRNATAFEKVTCKILIISKAFPWSIDVSARSGDVVTCGDIFKALHKKLQKPIKGVEWAIVADRTRGKTIKEAAESRQKKDRDKQLKRIDWLGDMTMFEGIEKDEEWEKKMRLPTSRSVPETWVVKFGSRHV